MDGQQLSDILTAETNEQEVMMKVIRKLSQRFYIIPKSKVQREYKQTQKKELQYNPFYIGKAKAIEALIRMDKNSIEND